MMVRAHVAIGAVLAALMTFGAQADQRAAASTHRTASSTAEARLARQLNDLLTDPRFAHASWAADVRSLRTGEPLFSHHASRLMVPASNQKLLTAMAAAERLGWDHRFVTRVLTTGALDADGTLKGDLVVVGNGDPTINPRHPARWGIFDLWARTLADRGIRIISGHLIGDDNAFAEPGWGDGWAWDDLQFGFGSAVGALQYNENQVEVVVGPGLTAGARAIISTAPLGSGLVVDHAVTTAPAGADTRVAILRVPGTVFLTIKGQIALDATPVTMFAAVENPTRLYVGALREALARHGIFVGGNAVDVDELRAPPDMRAATELIVDHSPPLAEIVDVTLKWSRNGYAETLLLAMSPESPATMTQGLTALGSTLREWGAREEDYIPHDGSGLSRYDYVTAEMLTWLLARVWADSKHRDHFRAALPEAGRSGTLAERLKETPAVGRVWAKTGTMANVRSLSGYLLTREDEPLAFAILANDFRVPSAEIDALVDRAVVLLTEFSRKPM
jgi:D-alanyl-D-alanine carboxypeptidase/D-alanyl-D-alanine-endopeptidase (penicillin-binding protein 4)